MGLRGWLHQNDELRLAGYNAGRISRCPLQNNAL
jgi:hypothetical protein